MDLELDLWRVLNHPQDFTEAFVEACRLLEGPVPHRHAELWAIDPAHDAIVRVAETLETGAPARLAHAQLAYGLFEAKRVRALGPSEPLAIAMQATDPALAIALVQDRRAIGFLRLVGARGEDALLERLAEPFTAALAHWRRVEELAVLREAAEADNRALLTRLSRQALVDSVVGERTGLRDVMRRVEQVAPTDAPVLLLGETGSGKEVIARAIHERSARREGPMVRVNCGAIAPELIDSELFGHEKGSFTGAVSARKGWFERAHGGTLLLDEVGELPLAAQVRLLRVLQDGALQRVGAERTTYVDVRIVAATHRDLPELVNRGGFREDLWYRLSVFPLRLPPLRERREDVPILASHFAARVGERLGGTPLTPTAEDVRMLLAYDWPGNVRELAAVIERAAILGHAKRLDVAAALGATPARFASAPPPPPPPPSNHGSNGAHHPPIAVPGARDDTLDAVMVAHIERILARTRGRIEGAGGAADVLGINPHTLRARMRKLKIDWARFR